MLEPGAPFHIHFSDIQFANRNETKHLPYGEGTLRAEPLRRGARALRAAGDGDLRVAGRRVDRGDQGDPRGVGSRVAIRQRLLETPADRVTPELAKTVADFCEPIDVIASA